jgi:hypothetical protein
MIRSKYSASVIRWCLIFLLGSYSCKSQSKSSSSSFIKHTITKDFISEGASVADVNKDGKTDIMAGYFWFEAPNWKRHEISEGKTFDPAKEYSNSFLNVALDVNLDGWTDQVLIDFPGKVALWFENPQNKDGHWKKYVVHDSVGIANESPGFVDVDGDGRVDILCGDVARKQIVWLKAPVEKGSTQWTRFALSDTAAPGTEMFSHGMGMGDINKDGIADVIVKQGWWEGPKDPRQPNWKFHEANLGEDCSHMHVLDVNGDGRNDVLSTSAHRFGIWWHEQLKENAGKDDWKTHEISRSVSQTHSTRLFDLNADGNPDFITGKRFFAHNDSDVDPGTHEPAKIIWFEFTPGKKTYWKEHEIDDDSGVGLNITIEDMNGDKSPDIVISNKKGVYYFENRLSQKK